MALPPQLFYGTGIPACLWFMAKDRSGKPTRGVKYLRDRRGEVLFIDARKMGVMVSRVHRELTGEEIGRIAGTYHEWRGELEAGDYEDVAGFAKSATLEEIREHGQVLTPGRYVGAAEVEDDDEPFEQKIKRLVAELDEQFAESNRLEAAIRKRLRSWFDG